MLVWSVAEICRRWQHGALYRHGRYPSGCSLSTPCYVWTAGSISCALIRTASSWPFCYLACARAFAWATSTTSQVVGRPRATCAQQEKTPKVVDRYLATECGLGRVVGPVSSTELGRLPLHVSRFGVIPKRHQPGKWRPIVDLSAPKGESIHDGIEPKLFLDPVYIQVRSGPLSEVLRHSGIHSPACG